MECLDNRLKLITLYLTILVSPVAIAQSIVFYTDQWAPYNYMVDNEIQGISTDLIRAALAPAELSYQIKMRPWARAYLTVQKTPNTALFTVNRSASREMLFKWVGPLLASNIYLFKLKENHFIKIKGLNDLKRYSVGVLRNGSVHSFLKNNGLPDDNMNLHSHAEQHIRMLLAKRLDLVPGDEIDLKFQLKNRREEFYKMERACLLYRGAYYIAFNINTPDKLITQIQQALDQALADGIREEILSRYLFKEAALMTNGIERCIEN